MDTTETAAEQADHPHRPLTPAEQLAAIFAGELTADGGEIAALAKSVLHDYRALTTEVDRLNDLAKDHWQESEDEFDRCVAAVSRAVAAEAERDELRDRIGNARAEIARQDVAGAKKLPADTYWALANALAKVETRLADPEYRPGGAKAGS